MSDKEKKDIIGKAAKPIPVPKKEIGIDTDDILQQDILDAVEVSQLNTSALESFSNVAQTREQVYNLIDTMTTDDTVSAVLETYAEDATAHNDLGKVVWCSSDDENVSKYVTYLLDSLDVDKHAYSWIFKLCKDGDLYLKMFRESDVGNDVLFGDEEDKKDTLNEDVTLNMSKKGDHYVHYVEAVANPGEMFELTQRGKTMGYIQAPVTVQQTYDDITPVNQYLNYRMKKKDVCVYKATDFVHACLQNNTSRVNEEVSIFLNDADMESNNVASTYNVRKGQSLLYNSFKIWRELSLLENSVILNRITKSAIIRIISLDGGDMPKEQVNNYLQRFKQRVEQKMSLNVGKSGGDYNDPGPVENIIYTLKHGEQGNITAQTIGGDVNVGDLTDLDYFQNKFYGSLRAPKQFFGITDDAAGFNGGSSLSIISSRYGKAVQRIQETLCQCITDLINLLLLDKGLNSYVNQFKIHMQTPITQEELDKREDMRNRVGVISDEMNQINSYVKDEVTQTKIFKILASSAINEPEVIQLIQDDIDKREAEAEEGKKPSSREEERKEDNTLNIGPSEEESIPEEPEVSLEAGEESPETIEEPSSTTTSPEEESGSEESYLPSFDELNIDGTSGI